MKKQERILTALEILAKDFFVGSDDDTFYETSDRRSKLVSLLTADIGKKSIIDSVSIELMSRDLSLGSYQSLPGESVIKFTMSGITGFLRIEDNASSWTEVGHLGEEFFDNYFVEVKPVTKQVIVFEEIK